MRTVDDVLPGRHPSKEDNLFPYRNACVVEIPTERDFAEAPNDEVLVVKDDGGVVLGEGHCFGRVSCAVLKRRHQSTAPTNQKH